MSTSAAALLDQPAPASVAHTLGMEEVETLRQLVAREGEPRVILALGLSRLTLARLLARMSVRAGTLLLVRTRMAALSEALLAGLGGRQRRAPGGP